MNTPGQTSRHPALPCPPPGGLCGNGLRWASLAAVAALLVWALWGYGLAGATEKAWVDAHVRGGGVRGICLYVVAVTVLVGVGVPRQVCSLLGGYAFGVSQGALWATVGTGLACLATFGCARFWGQTWVQRRYGGACRQLNAFLCQSPFLLSLVVRIVPLGSNFLTNILAAVSPLPALPFLTGSLVGFAAQNLIFALIGSGVAENSPPILCLSGALYVLSLALGLVIYRRYRRFRAG